MFSIESDPKICVVKGETIRQMIRDQIAQIDVAIATYDEAIAAKRAGYDWHCLKDTMLQRRRAAVCVLPAVGDGPFDMTIKQWVGLSNMFAEVLDADRVLEKQRRDQEHAASHAAAGEGVSLS